MYASQTLRGLGETSYSPTESDLGLFSFVGNVAYQKVGLDETFASFAIQFPPQYHASADINGRWERVSGSNTTIPGTPGQALWVWNPRVDKPYPAAGTVLQRDVAGKRLLIADGSGGSYWRVWNYPAAGTVIETMGTGNEYIELVADGQGGTYSRGPGVSGGSGNALLWVGLAALLLLS
jgi:hypothetical protein